MSPINVTKQLIDDARTNNKEIWLYLQDLSKCYDRVDTRILRHAMTRLKIPFNFIDLVIDLFTNRRNYVLTDVGKTPDYEVLVGIDQGEVISPLLWCIYYDPLLTKVEQQELGYNIVHQYRPNIYDRHAEYNCITVGDLAFMDDTTWITETKESLEEILKIADDF